MEGGCKGGRRVRKKGEKKEGKRRAREGGG